MKNNQKIRDMLTILSPSGDEMIPVAKGGKNYKISVDTLADYIGDGGASSDIEEQVSENTRDIASLSGQISNLVDGVSQKQDRLKIADGIYIEGDNISVRLGTATAVMGSDIEGKPLGLEFNTEGGIQVKLGDGLSFNEDGAIYNTREAGGGNTGNIEIENSLNSSSAVKALAAAQGKVLNEKITALSNTITGLPTHDDVQGLESSLYQAIEGVNATATNASNIAANANTTASEAKATADAVSEDFDELYEDVRSAESEISGLKTAVAGKQTTLITPRYITIDSQGNISISVDGGLSIYNGSTSYLQVDTNVIASRNWVNGLSFSLANQTIKFGNNISADTFKSSLSLHKVATSGSYNDLSDLPSIPNIDTLINDGLATRYDVAEVNAKFANYLPLSGGGTISGSGSDLLIINRTQGNPLVGFHSNGDLVGFLGVDTEANPCYIDPINYVKYELIHTGNIDSQTVKSLKVATNLNPNDSMQGELFSTDYNTNLPTGADSYLTGITLAANNDSKYRKQIGLDHYGKVFTRGERAGVWDDWKTVAFTDSTVAAANKLSTARTIWGQSFDGSGNVSGNIILGQGRIIFDSTLNHYIGLSGSAMNYNNAGGHNFFAGGALSFIINNSRNVTIGSSDLAQSDYKAPKLYVDGEIVARIDVGNTIENKTLIQHYFPLEVGRKSNTMVVAIGVTDDDYGVIQSKGYNITSTGQLAINPQGGNVYIGGDADTGFRPKMTVYNNGNVGIGTTTSPQSKLHVEGTIRTSELSLSDGNNVATIRYAYGTGVIDVDKPIDAIGLKVQGKNVATQEWTISYVAANSGGSGEVVYADPNYKNGIKFSTVLREVEADESWFNDRYLRLGGGAVSGSLSVAGYLITADTIVNKSHFFFVRDNANADWIVTDKDWQHEYDLIHSGNIGSYNAGGLSSKTPQLAAKTENNEITIVDNENGIITTNKPTSTLSSIRKAIDFRWYGEHWQIGAIRGDGEWTEGFGVTFGNDNLVFSVNKSGHAVFGGNLSVKNARAQDVFILSHKDSSNNSYVGQFDWEDNCLRIQPRIEGVTYDIPVSLCPYGGNVGIGTTNPQAKLDIVDSSGMGNLVNLQSNNVESSIRYTNSNGKIWVSGVGAGATGDSFFIWSSISGHAIVADNSGKVGIGTTSPTAKLHVNGSARFDGVININGKDIAYSNGVDTAYFGNENLPAFISGTSVNLRYGTTIGMILNSSGNVGIGTTSPVRKLHINDNSGIPAILQSNQGTTALGFSQKDDGVAYLAYSGGTNWKITNRNWSAEYTLIHSGNYSEYISFGDGIAFSSNIASIDPQWKAGGLIQLEAENLDNCAKGTLFRSVYGKSTLPTSADSYLTGITLASDDNDAYRLQLGIDLFGEVFTRSESGGTWSDWRSLAFTSSTVAAAEKLTDGTSTINVGGYSVYPTAHRGMNLGAISNAYNNVFASGYIVSNTETEYCGLVRNTMITDSGSATDFWLYNLTQINYSASKHVFDRGNVGIGTYSPSAKLHVNGNTKIDGELGGNLKDWVNVQHNGPLEVGRANNTMCVAIGVTDDNYGYIQTKGYGITSAAPLVLQPCDDDNYRGGLYYSNKLYEIIHSGNYEKYTVHINAFEGALTRLTQVENIANSNRSSLEVLWADFEIERPKIANGYTAYGWGNHASAGYAKLKNVDGHTFIKLSGGIESEDSWALRIGTDYFLSNVQSAVYADYYSASVYLGTPNYRWLSVYALSYDQSSDATQKDIIGNIELTTSQIANAPAVEFTWKRNGLKDVGTLAQYWKDVLPEIVSGEEGNMGMNYATLGVVSAIVLARSVETHEERIARLEREISELQDELDALVKREKE